MRLSKKDISTYKEFAKYLSTQMPLVTQVGIIIKAIKKHSGVSDEQVIKQALQWNNGPLIVPTKNLKGTDGSYGYAQFDPNKPDQIAIHEVLVRLFEKGRTMVTAPNGKRVVMAGVALLHELVHWADELDGEDMLGVEEGEEFENEIYGGAVEYPGWELITTAAAAAK